LGDVSRRNELKKINKKILPFKNIAQNQSNQRFFQRNLGKETLF
jgi:hypothetical protein